MITLKKNGYAVPQYMPEYTGKHIVIAIDSSKSNTAMIVGSPTGQILDDYEISGAGADTDVYDLCQVTRDNIRLLFDGAKIVYVGIEDIITKKEKGYNGIEIHQSRYKITAVFDNFIFTFMEFFKVRPHLINNNNWKSAILPEEYRRHTHKKGSRDFMRDTGSNYGYRKDDVTDAICIYRYIIQSNRFEEIRSIVDLFPCNKEYDYIIVPDSATAPGAIKYEVANSGTLDQNMSTVAYHLKPGQLGMFKWPIDQLTIDQIYSEHLRIVGKSRFGMNDTDIQIVVSLED